jgi:hypothetical protein
MPVSDRPSRDWPRTARYRPYARGRYSVGPGLGRLGRDLGNGDADGRAIQFDADWRDYRAVKLRARRAGLARMHGVEPDAGAWVAAALRLLIQRLIAEYPQWFDWQADAAGGCLACALTGEHLRLDAGGRLLGVDPRGPRPSYRDALDALAGQIMEDVAVVAVDAQGRDRLCALQVCMPHRWAPDEKLGRDFAGVHRPVPGFAPVAAGGRRLLRAVVDGGPYVRFVWGLTRDPSLTQYAREGEPRAWPCDPRAPWWLRIERQVMLPLGDGSGYLFLIRSYREPVSGLPASDRALLAGAVEGMDADELAYKDLSGEREGLLRRLRGVGSV